MKEVIIGRRDGIMRAAFFEEGKLFEYISDEHKNIKTGDIYSGTVTNTVKELNSAFVKIANDDVVYLETKDRAVKPGNNVLLQIRKEAFQEKYPAASLKISLAGKFAVLYNEIFQINISKKITDREERKRLKDIVKEFLINKQETEYMNICFVLRTESAYTDEKYLIIELEKLYSDMIGIIREGSKQGGNRLVYTQNDFIDALIKNKINKNIDRIMVQGSEIFEEVHEKISEVYEDGIIKLKLYTGENDIFQIYNTDTEIRRLESRKIWLKSGGYIIVDITEAMTVIDVNSGKYDGEADNISMVNTVNIQAAEEIARVLHFRNIGGIIIVDFLKIREKEDKERLIGAFREIMGKCDSDAEIVGITGLGLIEMTRKRK